MPAREIKSVYSLLRNLLPGVDVSVLVKQHPRILLTVDQLPEKFEYLLAVRHFSPRAQARFLQQMSRPATAGRLLVASPR